jgi:hypothetical protein
MNSRNKSRLILLAIVLVFAAPMIVAFVMHAEGFRPAKTRNSGTLVYPPRDVGAVPVTLADGHALVWRDPQWQWTLLALPGAQCADKCRERLDEMLRMRITLGRSADRLRIVYIGPALPAEALAARAPLLAGNDTSAALSVYRTPAADDLALALVDPNGLLMMVYPAGYSAVGVRADLKQVFHEGSN